MIAFEQFHSMKLGDVIEAPGLMQGVSDEPLLLTLTGVSKTKHKFFQATYFGVALFRQVCRARKGVLIWETV